VSLQLILDHIVSVVRPALRKYLAAEEALTFALTSNDASVADTARQDVMLAARQATDVLHHLSDCAVRSEAPNAVPPGNSKVVHCPLRISDSIGCDTQMPSSVKANLLDDGVVDTLVSAGAASGVNRPLSPIGRLPARRFSGHVDDDLAGRTISGQPRDRCRWYRVNRSDCDDRG
jgi:hypothetical protein